MTTTLRSTFRAEIGWTWRDQLATLTFSDSNRLVAGDDLADGGGDGQANRIWHALEQTLDAGQATHLNLADLPQSMFGGTIRLGLAAVKAVLVVNRSTARLRLGGSGETAWVGPFGSGLGTLEVAADSPVLLVNRCGGWPVTAGHTLLRVEALEAPAEFDIVVLGVG